MKSRAEQKAGKITDIRKKSDKTQRNIKELHNASELAMSLFVFCKVGKPEWCGRLVRVRVVTTVAPVAFSGAAFDVH